MPIASIPIPQIGVSSLEWATALARFDAAIAALGPVAIIFNAAEGAYFALSKAGASNRGQMSAAKAALR